MTERPANARLLLKDRPRHFKIVVGAIGAAFVSVAVVLAFFSVPALRFAGAVQLFNAGCALSACVFNTIMIVQLFPLWKHFSNKLFRIAAVAYAIIPYFVFLYLTNSATDEISLSALANDRRCLAIQRDMLSPRPLRTDDAEMFSALGCRPQGEGSVHAIARAKR